MTFELVVYGHPEPAGSKRAFPIKRANGQMGASVSDANPKAKDWKGRVSQAAGEEMNGRELMEGPLVARFVFYRARPKGHFGTGRNAGVLKKSAPRHPTTKPDVLKLTRGVEDALTGIVYRDDAQIVHEEIVKLYGTPERVEVRVVTLRSRAV